MLEENRDWYQSMLPPSPSSCQDFLEEEEEEDPQVTITLNEPSVM